MSEHAEMIVADAAARLGQFQLRADHAANKGIGQVNQPVLLLGSIGQQGADVCKLVCVSQGCVVALASADNDVEDSLDRDERIAAHVQIRRRISRVDMNGAAGAVRWTKGTPRYTPVSWTAPGVVCSARIRNPSICVLNRQAAAPETAASRRCLPWRTGRCQRRLSPG